MNLSYVSQLCGQVDGKGEAMCARRRANLTLMLDRDSKKPLHEQIYEGIAEAVRTGRLRAGEHLPSVRQLSGDLFVSHTIVERAYLELSVEGYVRAKPRSGYVVEDLDTSYFEEEPRGQRPEIALPSDLHTGQGLSGEEEEGAQADFDFSFMRLREGSFPLRAWQRACTEVCLGKGDFLEHYAYHGQVTQLQQEIARYLRQTRDIDCDPRQVLVEPGSPAAVTDLLRLFDARSDLVWVEEPGWQVPRLVATDTGFGVSPLDISAGKDGFAKAMQAQKPKLIFLTPSHQFPTGRVLPLTQRVQALEWAAESGAYLVEDDSCFEYRYDMRPIPSLFSLDKRDRTIYLGNFSKVLSPSLRIAYLVLPPQLLSNYLERYPSGHPGVSSFDANVLAQLMASGDYDRHVARMVRANKRVHDRLLACLEGTFGDRLTITGKHSGMHLYVQVRNGMTTDELIASALAEGAKAYSTARYWFSRPAQEGTVMLGFSALREEQIEPGVTALARAWMS